MERIEPLAYLVFSGVAVGALVVGLSKLHALAVRRGWVKSDDLSDDDTAW
jgi:hypothetical protein